METDRRGVVHSLTTTHAAAADISQLPALLHGAERALYGDQTYWSESDRGHAEAAGLRYRVSRRPTKQRPLSDRWQRINRARARTRSRVRARRARVSCGEDALGLYHRALPRAGQEHGAGLRRLRAREPVSDAPRAGGPGGEVSLVTTTAPATAPTTAMTGENRQETLTATAANHTQREANRAMIHSAELPYSIEEDVADGGVELELLEVMQRGMP